MQNRTQLVEFEYYDENVNEIKNAQSNIKLINCSIPQGSVIGCLFFLLYINDLPKCIKSTCVLFADDISILFKTPVNIDYAEIEKVLLETKRWLNEHNLEINYNKTKIVQFRTYQRPPLNLGPFCTKNKIEEIDNFKLLGLTLDTHLNWKKHIEQLKSKLSQFSYALGILKRNTNFETALTAYYAFVYSRFNYGIILWGESVEFDSLFILQKKCIRILANIKQPDSCKPHFIERKILTLPSIYILQIALFVRNNRTLYKSNLEINPNYHLRNKDRLVSSANNKLKITRNSPYCRSLDIYNRIPKIIKQEEDTHTFHKKLKSFLIEKAYYSVKEFEKDVKNI